MRELNFLILVFIISPILFLIHEVGHAFFAKLFGGTIDKIILGTGKPIIRIGKLEIRALFFSGGMYFSSNLRVSNSLTRILICLGGIIFNLLFALILFMLMRFNIIPYSITLDNVMKFSLFLAVINALPINLGGMDTDGKHIYLYFKNNKLEKLSNDIKTFPIFLEKVDKEINRLGMLAINSRYDFMKLKYLSMIVYKANKLDNMGETDKAVLTLMSVNINNFELPPDIYIDYYNNLLYFLLILNRLDEADKVHFKLEELLNKMDFENITSGVKDTLATYEFFKGNFDKSKNMFLEIMGSSPDNQGKTCNYFLSQIYVREDKTQEAIDLLNSIEESKVAPYIYVKAMNLKASLEIN